MQLFVQESQSSFSSSCEFHHVPGHLMMSFFSWCSLASLLRQPAARMTASLSCACPCNHELLLSGLLSPCAVPRLRSPFHLFFFFNSSDFSELQLERDGLVPRSSVTEHLSRSLVEVLLSEVTLMFCLR